MMIHGTRPLKNKSYSYLYGTNPQHRQTNELKLGQALEYASSIWSPLTSSTNINKLQVMQNAALRTATLIWQQHIDMADPNGSVIINVKTVRHGIQINELQMIMRHKRDISMCYAQLIDVCSSASDSIPTTSSRSHRSKPGRKDNIKYLRDEALSWHYILKINRRPRNWIYCVGGDDLVEPCTIEPVVI